MSWIASPPAFRAARSVSERSLDSAFARLEHAEALNRIANATGEWAKQEHARAGEELTSGVDHFERAAKNARIELDAARKRRQPRMHGNLVVA
jgi:hypothetical protein